MSLPFVSDGHLLSEFFAYPSYSDGGYRLHIHARAPLVVPRPRKVGHVGLCAYVALLSNWRLDVVSETSHLPTMVVLVVVLVAILSKRSLVLSACVEFTLPSVGWPFVVGVLRISFL